MTRGRALVEMSLGIKELDMFNSYIDSGSNYLNTALSNSSYLPYDSGVTISDYLPT